MARMSDGQTPRPSTDPDTLALVAALVREATRLANVAAGADLRSLWLDVVAEAVTASGYMTDVPGSLVEDASDVIVAGQGTRSVGARALATLERAADTLDDAPEGWDYRAILVRAALTDAIDIARRIR